MFAEFFTFEHFTTFLILTALETVLGFDNLLYISIEAKRVGKDKEAYVRRMGIVLAIALRIVLLFVVLKLIDLFQEPFYHFDYRFVNGAFSGHSLIVLVGGAFLIHTAIKEIFHMLTIHDMVNGDDGRAKRSLATLELHHGCAIGLRRQQQRAIHLHAELTVHGLKPAIEAGREHR